MVSENEERFRSSQPSRSTYVLRYGLSGVVSGKALPSVTALAPRHVFAIESRWLQALNAVPETLKPKFLFTGTTAENSIPGRTLRVRCSRPPTLGWKSRR